MSGRVTPIVALDVGNSAAALDVVDELGDLCRFFKVGSELYTAEGASVVHAVRGRGASVFLDLKFHDIPNTVRGAVRSAATLGVQLLTVHASGGRAMMEAAVAAAHDVASDCGILAVTVLTSMDADAVSDVWGRRVADVEAEVLRLAQLARDAGVHGIVCSGREAAAVRAKFGDQVAILVPGVRLTSGDRQDQARVVTPSEAAAAGARYIVVGRAVTGAKSPRCAMNEVLSDLP
ncbi:MAG: orotidine-5'-phosphate decarboxylase [Gemmatimonadaceae bacterium]